MGAGDAHASKKRKRQQILVSCNLCRQRHVKCDGKRPVCTPCRSKSMTGCKFDTEADGESRQASLKRGNKALTERLLALEGSQKHICEMPSDQVRSILNQMQKTADPASTLISLQLGTPAASMEQYAAQAVLPAVQTKLERELMVINPVAYQTIDAIDVQSLVVDVPSDSFSLQPFQQLSRMASVPMSQHFRINSNGKLPAVRIPDKQPHHKGPEPPPSLCDSRLMRLDVPFWTKVPASTEFVARALSRWLCSYQAFECFFDPDLFIDDLVSKGHTYCSSLLVNAVMYIACLGYSSIDKMAMHLRFLFEAEAERLWLSEPGDSLLRVSACHILSIGYTWDNQEPKGARYFHEGVAMVSRMDLHCINNDGKRKFANLPRLDARSHAYTAWGVFNYHTLRSFYYRTDAPVQAPDCPIPGEDWTRPEERSILLDNTFKDCCHLWALMHELAILYCKDPEAPLAKQCTLPFAERKYREILEWSKTLSVPAQDSHGALGRHLVFRMHLHGSIMDIFRPFIDQFLSLSTFSALDATPEAVFLASLNQLKHLALVFYSNFPEAKYSTQWQHACLYIANATVRNSLDPDWKFYFLLSLQGYLNFTVGYPFTRMVFTSLLSIAVSKGRMPMIAAKRLYDEMVAITTEFDPNSSFLSNGKIIVDQEAAMSGQQIAHMDDLAEDLTFRMACDDFLELAPADNE